MSQKTLIGIIVIVIIIAVIAVISFSKPSPKEPGTIEIEESASRNQKKLP